MPKVICTRPNASLNINGVKFTPTEDGAGVISDDVSDEAAELFLSIPGYELAEEGAKKPAPVAKAAVAKPAAAPAKAAAKKAAPTPAPVQEPSPETPAAPPAAAESEDAAANADADTQDTDTGAGKGDGPDDPNVF